MFRRFLSGTVIICFFLTSLAGPYPQAHADTVLGLPQPGTMVNLTPAYVPVIVKGLRVHPENPILFDFIVDTGNTGLTINDPKLKAESEKLMKYFLASLTIPEDDLWVNLSPYEKNRIIPEQLGQTEMGRDMLAEDYILKQLTASLIYPEKNLGKEFWNRVYSKARQLYGTSEIPVNTFNKVWIVADKADVYVHDNTAFVVGSHLKVMLEEDYLALTKHQRQPGDMFNQEQTKNVSPSRLQTNEGLQLKAPQGNNRSTNTLASQVVRDIVLPELEKEVNSGKNFANLRQIFQSMILAIWYKKDLKEALLNQVYSNKSKINGVDVQDKSIKEKIYRQYLKAYKTGVFNYIKEDIQPNGQSIPRKYFSGGLRLNTRRALREVPSFIGSSRGVGNLFLFATRDETVPVKISNNAMLTLAGKATDNPEILDAIVAFAKSQPYDLTDASAADFRRFLENADQDLLAVSQNIDFKTNRNIRLKLLLASWATAYSNEALGPKRLNTFFPIALNYFREGNQENMRLQLGRLGLSESGVNFLNGVLGYLKPISDEADRIVHDQLLQARQNEQNQRLDKNRWSHVNVPGGLYSKLLTRVTGSPWAMKGSVKVLEAVMRDKMTLIEAAPKLQFANGKTLINLTVFKYSLYKYPDALLNPRIESTLVSFLSKQTARSAAISSIITAAPALSIDDVGTMFDEVQSLYELLSTQTAIIRAQRKFNITVNPEFTHKPGTDVLEDYLVTRYPKITKSTGDGHIFQVIAQTNHGPEVLGQLTFTGDATVVDQIVAALNELHQQPEIMASLRKDRSPKGVFDFIQQKALEFVVAQEQNNLGIVDYYNDAFAAASGEQKSPGGALRLADKLIAGIAFIFGTGLNGAVVDANGNHVTLGGILTELGHNIVWRKSTGQWEFTGRETKGKKAELQEGDYTIEQAFSGPNIAKRYTNTAEAANDINQYLVLENTGFNNWDEVAQAINKSGNLTEADEERRQAATKIVTAGITKGVNQNDPKMIAFAQDIGTGIGQALAAFMQDYLDEEWARNFILVSGISENFARIPQKVGEEDIFVHSIREGFRNSLKAKGVADEKINPVADGIRRSNLGWQRETMAAALTAGDLEVQKLAPGAGYVTFAVSVGGTKIGMSALTEDGQDIDGSHLEVKWSEKGSSHPDDIIPLIVDMIIQIAQQKNLDISKIVKIGVAFPAPVNKELGVVGHPFGPPNLHEAFTNYNLADAIKKAWARKMIEISLNAAMIVAAKRSQSNRTGDFVYNYNRGNLNAVGKFNLTDYEPPSAPKLSRRGSNNRLNEQVRGPQETATRGGIDLNARNMQMGINGEKLNIKFDPIMVARFKRGDFSGVRPVIIDITPLADIMPLIKR